MKRLPSKPETLGTIHGANQGGSELRVRCIDWQPEPGDTFFVRCVHRAKTDTGMPFVVTETPERGEIVQLKIFPPIIRRG